MMTTTELARRLEGPVSPTALLDLARRGLLPAAKAGRRWVFPPHAIAAARRWLAGHAPGDRWPRDRARA